MPRRALVSPALIATLVSAFVLLARPSQAQDAWTKPIPSLCAACDALAEQLKKQTARILDLERRYAEAKTQQAKLVDAAIEAEVDLQIANKFISPTAATRAARIQGLQARATLADAAADAMTAQANALFGEYLTAISEWVRTSIELRSCNDGCAKTAAEPPLPDVNTTGPPAPVSQPAPPPALPEKKVGCGPCEPPGKALKPLDDEHASNAEEIRGHEFMIATGEAENARDEAYIQNLKASKTVDPKVAAERIRELQLRIGVRRLKQSATYERRNDLKARQATLEKQLIPAARAELKQCNNSTCRTLFRPWLYLPVAGAVIGGALVSTGRDGPSLASPAAVTPAPATPAAAPAPAPAPAGFTINLAVGWNHPQGANESVECKVITTDPPQPGAAFTVQTTGPGVIPGQNVSGVLDSSGRARFQVRINQVGPYANVVTVTSTTMVQRTATATVTVTGTSNNCPQ